MGTRSALLGAVLASMSGCIGAPGVPAGPLQGTGVSFNGSYGYAFSPARVTMQSTTNGQRSGFRDSAGDALNFPIVPSRVGGRVGITDCFDAAGDLSWLDGGFELRAGLPEGSKPFPLALALEVRRGKWGALETDNRFSTQQGLRLEAYPRLARLEYVRLNLITSVGLSTGRRYHPLILPDRFQYYDNSSEGYPGPTFDPQVLREETRFEMSAGVELRQRNFFLSLVLLPYVVTKAKQASGSCDACYNWRLSSYESSFGAALFFTGGVAFNAGKHEPDARSAERGSL